MDFALGHRLRTVLLVLLLSIWGVISYPRLPKDIYPDLNAPLVKIITENPGMASEDVERLISFPLESLLSGAPHVTRVRSEAGTGGEADPIQLRSGADWTIRYRLQGVPGISFIINLGGFVKQFQVFLQPEMLKNYDITIAEVKEAIEKT